MEAAKEISHTSPYVLKKLIVVAYNIQDPTALGILETIAAAGWPRDTSGRDLEPALGTDAVNYPYLVRANGPVELRNMLNSAMRGGQSGVTSRSVPISVNTGDATSGPDSKRFDVTAGFERLSVSGASRVPCPPARTIPRMRMAMRSVSLPAAQHRGAERVCPVPLPAGRDDRVRQGTGQ